MQLSGEKYRKVKSAILALLMLVCSAPFAYGVEVSITSPGWTWGRAYYPEDFERKGKDHLVYNIISEQALRFSKPDWLLTPEVFVRLDTKRDSIGSTYDNRFAGAVGARVTAAPVEGLKLSLGARYEQASRFDGSASADGITGFIAWNGWWQLMEIERSFANKLALSTWGEARTRYDQLSERDNGFLEAVGQGDLTLLIPHDKLAFLARAKLELNADTKNLAHRNWLQPTVALVARYQAPKNYVFEVGVQASSRHWFDGGSDGGLSGFVQFSRSWESLKKPSFKKQSSGQNQ